MTPPSVFTGGWKYNPNTGQFQAAFCRLLTRCGVKARITGNVVGHDSTDFVRVASDRAMTPATGDKEVESPFTNEPGLVTVATNTTDECANRCLVQGHISRFIPYSARGFKSMNF